MDVGCVCEDAGASVIDTDGLQDALVDEWRGRLGSPVVLLVTVHILMFEVHVLCEPRLAESGWRSSGADDERLRRHTRDRGTLLFERDGQGRRGGGIVRCVS